jgi:hypothetical protein
VIGDWVIDSVHQFASSPVRKTTNHPIANHSIADAFFSFPARARAELVAPAMVGRQ